MDPQGSRRAQSRVGRQGRAGEEAATNRGAVRGTRRGWGKGPLSYTVRPVLGDIHNRGTHRVPMMEKGLLTLRTGPWSRKGPLAVTDVIQKRVSWER